MKETKETNTIYIDNRILDNAQMKELTDLGFVLVPDKWITVSITEYKIYVKVA